MHVASWTPRGPVPTTARNAGLNKSFAYLEQHAQIYTLVCALVFHKMLEAYNTRKLFYEPSAWEYER